MRWSAPATLRALDLRRHYGPWPSAFLATARRIVRSQDEAAAEAVNLAMASLAVALEVLADLMPNQGATPFRESVRNFRADPELRAQFKARYASRIRPEKSEDAKAAAWLHTDPFCLESHPRTYWFDGETCERVACAYIARHTLSRRRTLLDVHQAGVRYFLTGEYLSPEGPSVRIRFLSPTDLEYVSERGSWFYRYTVHPIYAYQKSVRKLAGAEVLIESPARHVLDVDLQTGDLIHCFEGYSLLRQGDRTLPPLSSSPMPVRTVTEPPSESMSAPRPGASSLVAQYTFQLVKRACPDPNGQIAMNRAVGHYFHSADPAGELSGFSQKYADWMAQVVGRDRNQIASPSAILRSPEEKPRRSVDPRGIQWPEEGPFLNAILAVWIQAQLHVRDLPTDADSDVRANLPASLRTLSRDTDGAKPTWSTWARGLPNVSEFAPKQLIDAWCAVWKILEIVLQVHHNPNRNRITYSEFVEAMPVRVYANYEAEFEILRRQNPDIAEVP